MRSAAAARPCTWRGAQRSSLLCVGMTGNRSYGWRGSSPKYFMEFNQQFPSPSTTRVLLSENYRSHQHIITPSISFGPRRRFPARRPRPVASGRHEVPVVVLERDDAALGRQLLEHYQKGETVLMLYRKSSDKLLIQEHIQAVVNVDSSLPHLSRRLKQLTYHSAKGLQADAVFLLGDCQCI